VPPDDPPELLELLELLTPLELLDPLTPPELLAVLALEPPQPLRIIVIPTTNMAPRIVLKIVMPPSFLSLSDV